jgi:hypothetical protein
MMINHKAMLEQMSRAMILPRCTSSRFRICGMILTMAGLSEITSKPKEKDTKRRNPYRFHLLPRNILKLSRIPTIPTIIPNIRRLDILHPFNEYGFSCPLKEDVVAEP